MPAILIVSGGCGSGPGGYADGVLALPDGTSRGVETLASLDAEARPRHWARPLLAGLAGIVEASPTLPKPLGLVASAAGAGLRAIEGGLAPSVTLSATFADGARVVLATSPETAAEIARDQGLVRLALARLGVALPAQAAPDMLGAAAPALASMFEYEKRNGRVRRIAPVAREP